MTMVGVIKEKTTGKYSPFPYAAIFANATVCTIYGIFSKNMDLIICNAPGIVLAISYLIIFWVFCQPCPRYQSMALFVVLIIAIAGASIGLTFTDEDTSSSVFGILLDVTGMVQYGSPLVKVYDVIKSQSTKGLPLPLVLGTLFCATCWTIYSIIKKDIYVLLQNAVGTVLALFQLSLFCIFPNKKNTTKEDEMSPLPSEVISPISDDSVIIGMDVK